MAATLQLLADLLGETTLVFLLLMPVFLAVAGMAFFSMNAVSNRSAVRRRLTKQAAPAAAAAAGEAGSYKRTASRVAERAKRHMGPVDPGQMRKLRAKLVQAGFYDPQAVSVFFMMRLVCAVALAGAVAAATWLAMSDLNGTTFWLIVGVGGAIGYLAPQFYLNNRVKRRIESHRNGFPDFMDLMVICADSGLSMEASLERISCEITLTHPSLSDNLSIASAELRAGSSLHMALQNLASRLGVQEAGSFATLIQQSVELGSSITEALRVFSDDMRHRRLSAAEEKAYSLPAKLSVPLTLCILPVVMVVALLPIIVRLMAM